MVYYIEASHQPSGGHQRAGLRHQQHHHQLHVADGDGNGRVAAVLRKHNLSLFLAAFLNSLFSNSALQDQQEVQLEEAVLCVEDWWGYICSLTWKKGLSRSGPFWKQRKKVVGYEKSLKFPRKKEINSQNLCIDAKT